MFDVKSSKYYYYNGHTGESSWEKPYSLMNDEEKASGGGMESYICGWLYLRSALPLESRQVAHPLLRSFVLSSVLNFGGRMDEPSAPIHSYVQAKFDADRAAEADALDIKGKEIEELEAKLAKASEWKAKVEQRKRKEEEAKAPKHFAGKKIWQRAVAKPKDVLVNPRAFMRSASSSVGLCVHLSPRGSVCCCNGGFGMCALDCDKASDFARARALSLLASLDLYLYLSWPSSPSRSHTGRGRIAP